MSFRDDVHDGNIGRASGSIPSRSTTNTYEPKTDAGLSPGGGWQSLRERDVYEQVPESEQQASELAAQPETVALLEAETSRMAAVAFDGNGKPLPGQPSAVFSEEVLSVTESYRIVRLSNGTIRKDLIKK